MRSHVIIAAAASAIASVALTIAMLLIKRRTDKFNVLTIKSINFEEMLGNPRYDQWFMKNLRCNQASFNALCEILRAQMASISLDKYTKRHSFEKKVAVFLYFLGTQGGYREVSGVFGMSKSWCVEIVSLFTCAISQMRSTWISLPTLSNSWRRVEDGFKMKQSIPGVVGAIDGTLIEIQRPKDFDSFYNRHGDPSFNVQALVDHMGKLMSVDIRPGSFSDKKIWKMSFVGSHIRSLFPAGCFIIGDAGYCLFPWLIIPFLSHEEGGKLNNMQLQFNYILSSTRRIVECAFGRLKERFRTLKGVLSEKSLSKSCDLIMACMVLHNIFIGFNDSLFTEDEPLQHQNTYTQPHEARNQTPVESDKLIRQVARHRRNRLAKTMYKRRKQNVLV